MTQVYDDRGRLIPVTVVQAGPCTVSQVKTVEKDGYNAVQVGFGEKAAFRSNQAMMGHFKKAGTEPLQTLKEFRTAEPSELKVGDTYNLSLFKEGEKIDVIANTKGKGFQGVMKRYGFHGQPASHGSMSHRRPGSIGQCQFPGHVEKNRKMPGRMGDRKRTVQNLEVVKIFEDKNLVMVKGSLPGSKGSTLILRPGKKVRKNK